MIRMWRCGVCGKWSHAKRRPLRHERFVREGEATPDPATIIERVEGWGQHEPAPGGWRVRCGPFDEYVATPA